MEKAASPRRLIYARSSEERDLRQYGHYELATDDACLYDVVGLACLRSDSAERRRTLPMRSHSAFGRIGGEQTDLFRLVRRTIHVIWTDGSQALVKISSSFSTHIDFLSPARSSLPPYLQSIKVQEAVHFTSYPRFGKYLPFLFRPAPRQRITPVRRADSCYLPKPNLLVVLVFNRTTITVLDHLIAANSLSPITRYHPALRYH